MRIFYAAFLVFYLLVPSKSIACGYDWVGDCSSAVHLKINGTLDSFTIADCPSGIHFDGIHLGTLQTLSLANAKAITWESCQNNVSAVKLQYRLYEQGGGAGGFQQLALDQDYFTLLGPYTTRYRSKTSNINLTSGLTVGKTYVLEVYLLAEIDTIGDDFIPETILLKNNSGQNYKLTFTYGGPSAPPFVVTPTVVKAPNCYGESNGVVGVSVWGDQTGLFYNWSNVNLNFFQQNGLPAGTYTVTVTGANYSESETVTLGQPAVLTAQFSNVQPVSCGAGQGAATVTPGGGTAPYQYLWQNGQTTATANFPNSGQYSVSIFDAHQCNLTQTVNIPGAGLIQQNGSIEFCAGSGVQVGNVWIDSPGEYEVSIPGNGGCDTLLTLTATAIDPASLLLDLPSNITLSCNQPSINLCAEAASDALFQWSKDGVPATQTPCLLATAGGTYTLTATQQGCTAAKSIVSEEHLVPVPAQFVGLDTLTCDGFGATPTCFKALTNASNPAFLWSYNGQFLTNNDSCWFVISAGGFSYVLPELQVTDAYGCITQAMGNLSIKIATDVPLVILEANDATGSNIPDGSASVLTAGTGEFEILWSNGGNGPTIQNLLPGLYCVTVTSTNGCSASDCISVGFPISTFEAAADLLRLSPNPALPGQHLEILLPEQVEKGSFSLELFDGLGQSIKKEQQFYTKETLRFYLPTALSSGHYYLRILAGNRQLIGKVCIK